MLPSLPFRDASSRYRIYKYVPYLNSKYIKCTVIPPASNYLFDLFYDSVLFYKPSKISLIIKKIKKIIFYLIIITNRLWIILLKVKKYDVVIIHRMLFLGKIGFMELLLSKFNKNIIYDFDDALFEIKKFKNGIIKVIKKAKVIIAGNSYLANFASMYNDNVYIIPTSVDLKTYSKKIWEKYNNITIGWIGNPTNLKHIEFIKKALIKVLRLYKNVNLKIVCDESKINFPKDIKNRIQYERWRLEDEINFIKSFDIGIMPLIPNAYSKGKCGFKLIQYFAVGLPVVSTPVGVNCEIVIGDKNGFFAITENNWVDRLSILIENFDIRVKMGLKGRNSIINKFTIESNVNKLIDILRLFDENN